MPPSSHGEGGGARLVAWGKELRAVHGRLREALALTRAQVGEGVAPASATRDLLLFCHGFCAALNGHHEGEDHTLFPALAAAHPQLRPTLDRLEQDHSMIGYLLTALAEAVGKAAPPAELDRHLEGIEAIMESHFRYEVRTLLSVLDDLSLQADPVEVLGPLW
ncbi:hemerythrin domain-containing protein [Ornithinimicrobium sufpigmenti]|uniref:hemerythrin domain-containing protein n=1 Tax=Ornithinimicrobium sufpigmenti TaxID=2508882 RepID=UPI001036B315|nr:MULTISPECIES: hemerythrin domain-containing protein [unclassified Ornithinimicrobium]